MKIRKTFSPVLTLFLTLSLFLIMGCEPDLALENNQSTANSTVDAREMTPFDPASIDDSDATLENNNSPYPQFYKGFNHDTYPWADKSNPGPAGWCGTVEQYNGQNGPVSPSKGNGYATVEHGPCNDYWVNNLPITSGAPANTLDFGLFSASWPPSGFIQELDVYLDPADYSDGLAFRYVNSLNALNSTVIPFSFLYFHIDVTKTNGSLDVAGHTIDDEGWYTFRHVFNSDASGMLDVEFQLIDNGQPLHTKSIDQTFFGLTTSDYAVSELGSGYIWFERIASGVTLPIDEQHLHPANQPQ